MGKDTSSDPSLNRNKYIISSNNASLDPSFGNSINSLLGIMFQFILKSN